MKSHWGRAYGILLKLSVLYIFCMPLELLAAQIEVHGHRGARALRPENTIPAFQYALEVGVDVLELDLAVTKDKVLVASHDPHINSAICLDPKGKKIKKPPLIYSLTLKQLKRYDCGSLKNPRFPKQKPVPKTRIPTLEEIFDFVNSSPLDAAKKVRFNIETKITPENPSYTVPAEEFAKLVVDLVKKKKMLDRTILQSFDYRTLKAARQLDPAIRIAALSENEKEDLVQTIQDLKANVLSPHWPILTSKVVEELHTIGVKVIPWTANDPEAWAKLIALKVDGIITDDPEALLDYLKEQPK